jgi:two-component sensor histidine kinase
MTDPYAPTIEEALPAITPEDHARAILNILEDFAGEKDRLEETQRAVFNILEDFSDEKARLEEAQRAMLNLLDDFDVERAKAEAANRELSANEERLQITLGEKENLLKEIHHRVKNNLQIIHSMLNLQMSYIKNKKAIELFKESKNRVYSMALIHEKLYQSDSLAKIDLPDYVRGLTTNLFLSYGVSERLVKPVISIENVPLDIDRLIPFALIVTELISNSLKHAFPSLPEREEVPGEVRIELGRGPDNKLLLTVGDNGIGLPADLEIMESGSLGLKLVSVLVKQLRGTLQLGSGPGTEFRIVFEGPK